MRRVRTCHLLALVVASLLAMSPDVLAAPGDRFNVLPGDLPAPNTTVPRDLTPSFDRVPPNSPPQVPAGFAIALFASALKYPRSLAVAPEGDVFVVRPSQGDILRLRDSKNQGVADQVEQFAAGFIKPHGIAIREGLLYVSDVNAVWSANYSGRASIPFADFKRVTSAPDLRPEGWHNTRDIVFDPAGKLYLAFGSRDDVSEAPLPDGTIELVGADGAMTPFASGLRNVEGLAFYPGSSELWVTVNERDTLGARVPADFLAHVRHGDFFGWPYAYNGPIPDPFFGAKRPDMVTKSIVPDLLFEAHSAPLGLVFYTGKQFPENYRGDAFVAFHASGPYDKPDGYKVVRVPFKDGKPAGGYEDFVTGFFGTHGNKISMWGSPSQLAVATDGSLLIVDDQGNCIWRVSYTGK